MINVIHERNDGSRLVEISPDIWDGLSAAVEVAYDDRDAVPAEYADAGDELWDFFHPDQRKPHVHVEPERVLEVLHAGRTSTVRELALVLDVSQASIRRRLDGLISQGKVERVLRESGWQYRIRLHGGGGDG